VADQSVDKVIENEAKALKSAEAAFEAASAEIAKPVKAAVEAPAKVAEAVVAPAAAPAKQAPATAPVARARAAKPVRKAAPKAKVSKRKIKTPVRKAAVLSKTQGVKTMTTKTTKTAENIFGADRFQAAFGEINERARAASEKGAKMVEEMTDLTRGNVEAIVASSRVAQKGLETLGQTAADFGRKSFEDAQNAFKSFGEIRSATDFFKLQGDFARSAFDAAVAESARMSEQMLKIASDAAEPINSRYTVAAERVKTLVAA